jgi:hypothetical protein
MITSLEKTQALSQKLLNRIDEGNTWRQDIIDAINRSYDLKNMTAVIATPALQRSSCMGKQEIETFALTLLKHLKYQEMGYRHESIAQAHKKTFKWIFENPPKEQKWSSFVEWLSSNQDIYWITGKPGAGKSTLMKFLIRDSRTEYHLRKWASKEQLIWLAFYFWNSGSELQMSQEGLVRTILYDAFRSLWPEVNLVPIVFPHRLESYILLGHAVCFQQPWTLSELIRAFELFVQEATKSKRIVLFIDGLDEFHGNHSMLINLIQSLLGPNLKICVSGRPWNVFQDTFKNYPSLRLEDLTYSDIHCYVSSKFLDNPGFSTLQQLDPNKSSMFIKNVTIKACGVFLWVHLVVQSLLEGFSDGERLSDLQHRLDALPADLEELFWKILNSLDSFHFKRASELFQIIRAAIFQLSVLDLSFADENYLEPDFTIPTAPLSSRIAEMRAHLMKRRVNACCKGLLEADRATLRNCRIQYLHRTVKDFIQREDVWSRLLAATNNFNPNLRLFALCIIKLQTFDLEALSFGKAQLWDLVTQAIEYAARADPECVGPQFRMLQELDHVASRLATSENPRGKTLLQESAEYLEYELTHWTSTRMECRQFTSFLHLAVQCQLLPYVEASLKSLEVLDRTSYVSSLLYVAIRKYKCFQGLTGRPSVSHNNANAKLINILLEQGADPHSKVEGETILNIAIQEFPVMPIPFRPFFDDQVTLGVQPSIHSSLGNNTTSQVYERRYQRRQAKVIESVQNNRRNSNACDSSQDGPSDQVVPFNMQVEVHSQRSSFNKAKRRWSKYFPNCGRRRP